MELPNTDPEMVPLPLREIGVVLVKHYGLREGIWDVALHMNVSIGQIGPSQDKAFPGAMFTVSAIGLSKAVMVGPLTVNAAEVNPAD